jgi:hypothetical protein
MKIREFWSEFLESIPWSLLVILVVTQSFFYFSISSKIVATSVSNAAREADLREAEARLTTLRRELESQRAELVSLRQTFERINALEQALRAEAVRSREVERNRVDELTREAELAARAAAALAAAARVVPVAALLGSNEEPASPDHTWALVLADQTPRTLALCNAMLHRLQLVDHSLAPSPPRTRMRPIFWMLTRPSEQLRSIQEISCDDILGSLDKRRSATHGLGSDIGPKFLAVAVRGTVVHDVMFDLSDIPESEFGRAVRLWGDVLAEEPETWRASIQRLSWQEAFRGFLIRYSQPIESWIGSRPALAGPPTSIRFSILK